MTRARGRYGELLFTAEEKRQARLLYTLLEPRVPYGFLENAFKAIGQDMTPKRIKASALISRVKRRILSAVEIEEEIVVRLFARVQDGDSFKLVMFRPEDPYAGDPRNSLERFLEDGEDGEIAIDSTLEQVEAWIKAFPLGTQVFTFLKSYRDASDEDPSVERFEQDKKLLLSYKLN